MDLSIIIVNWNSKDYLGQALRSVEANVHGIDYEVVVIDSGSFDGSSDLVRREHPKAKFIQSDANLGFARANNEAFTAARGRVLLFLNPDTEVLGAAVQDLYRVIESEPDVGIVGPKLLNADGSIQETCIRALPTIWNQLLDSDCLRTRFPNARLWGKRHLSAPDNMPKPVEAVSGACLMMRRSQFEAVGLFSTDYFMYSEDMDLCLKNRRNGGRTLYVPSAVVVHFGGASSSQAPVSTFSAVMRLESQWRYFRKTRSDRYAAMFRMGMAAASVVRIAALLLAWPVQALRHRQLGLAHSLRKWRARLRWTLGGEGWARGH